MHNFITRTINVWLADPIRRIAMDEQLTDKLTDNVLIIIIQMKPILRADDILITWS